MEINILRMKPRHLPEVLSIENASFTTPWSMSAFLYEMRNPASICYVAEIDSQVAGYIVARHVLDEAHMFNLAVREDLRRKGIARALIKKTIEDIKRGGCKIIYLEVRESNLPARRLYESFGFKEVGIRRAYYSLPVEDAIVMTLEL